MAQPATVPDADASEATVPKMGPEPTLLSRKEVDALYVTLEAIVKALDRLQVDYIVTGGSLLGAVRQHSLLFCDDDIDVTIIDYPPGDPRDPYYKNNGSIHHLEGENIANNNNDQNDKSSFLSAHDRISRYIQDELGSQYTYSIRPWEAGDKVRPKFMTSVFVDIFTLRRFDTLQELEDLLGVKTNGQAQPREYTTSLISKITESAVSQGEITPLLPFWQFDTRKAVELWPKEVYRDHELFPLYRDLKFGPYAGIVGPRMPVLLLQRAFGVDCFDVYYPSISHKDQSSINNATITAASTDTTTPSAKSLPPRTLVGGVWESNPKQPLEDQHYIPMQPIIRAKRRPTLHNRQQLSLYLEKQRDNECLWQREQALRLNLSPPRPRRTVYMDGVFDMFHIGHLEAIEQCAALGDRVILGVVSDADAMGYKRPPIITQSQRVAIVSALRYVDQVICPNPFVITELFMLEHDIDLVVHGFADATDEERQREFFEVPIQLGKFKTIRYHPGLSTTDIIAKIQRISQ